MLRNLWISLLLASTLAAGGADYGDGKLLFVSPPVLRAYPGAIYSYSPIVKGGERPYRFSFRLAPKGMKIGKRTGRISWEVPAIKAGEAVSIRVKDKAGRRTEQTFTLMVGEEGFYFVSLSGDDRNPGSIKKPWKTLSKAAASLTAGQTVFLREGKYQLSRQTRPRNAGTKEQPITFARYRNEKATIDGGANNCLSLQFCKFITLRGLEMTTSSESVGASMIYMEDSDGCRFEDCVFYGMPKAVGRENTAVIRCMRTGKGFSDDCVVQNCLFRNNQSPALRLYTTKGWIIVNNEFRNCHHAVGGKDQPYDMIVRNNLIIGGELAFYFPGQLGCNNVTITENVVVGARRVIQIGGLGTNGRNRSNVRLVNNTLVDCINYIVGHDDRFNIGHVYTNNILYAAKAANIHGGSDTAGRLLTISKYAKRPINTQNYLMDWNCLSIPQSDTSLWFRNANLQAKSLAAWKSRLPPLEKHSISTDPRFVDPANGDYRLSEFSPCKGKGRNGEDLGAYPRGNDGTVIGRIRWPKRKLKQ